MPWKFAMPVVTCCRCFVAVTRVFSLLLPLAVASAADERAERDVGAIPALVTVRIPTLEQLATDSREETQPVSKSVMNSNVTGRQSTVTETRLRIIPESRPLQFELQTSGQIRSETTGVNPQALVDSVGQHQFEIIKPMWFDGTIFRTQKSHGTIQALQTPTRVRSVAGTRMPLVAPLGDQLAWNKVMRLQPRINQLVAAEVSKDVVPEIDQVIDQRFRDLGNQWVSLQQTISNALPVFSKSWHAAASRQSVHLWNAARSDTADRRGTQHTGAAGGGFVELQAGEDLAVSLSEDVLTRAIAAVVPTGQTVPDVALPRLKSAIQQTELADLPTMATQLRQVLKEAPALFALEFDERNPVTARCRDGQVDLTFHFRIHPNLGKASEWMSAAVSLTAEGLTRETWTVRVSSVDVRERGTAPSSGIATLFKPDESRPDFVIPGAPAPLPATEAEERSTEGTAPSTPATSTPAMGSAWTTVVRNSLQTLLQAAEPPRLPLEFSGPEMNAQATRLRMVRLRAEDGRLRVVLRLTREPAAKVSAR